MYYAIERPYGIKTLNTNGAQADKVQRFANKEERDQWVKADPAHRETATSNSAEVREAKNNAEQYCLDWPISI